MMIANHSRKSLVWVKSWANRRTRAMNRCSKGKKTPYWSVLLTRKETLIFFHYMCISFIICALHVHQWNIFLLFCLLSSTSSSSRVERESVRSYLQKKQQPSYIVLSDSSVDKVITSGRHHLTLPLHCQSPFYIFLNNFMKCNYLISERYDHHSAILVYCLCIRC